MNRNDPRLTQHVLGEENSAEMTEAANSDPANCSKKQKPCKRPPIAWPGPWPGRRRYRPSVCCGGRRREPPTVFARLGGR